MKFFTQKCKLLIINKIIKSAANKAIEIANIEVPEIIEETLKATTETITGLAKSSRADLVVSLGSLAQRIIAGQKMDSVRREWENLRKKGKIKAGYSKSLQSKYTLLELLNFLDSDTPDEERFQVLKNILLVAASEEKSSRDSIKPQQFMQLTKKLPPGAVLVMTSTYQLSKNPPVYDDQNGNGHEGDWFLAVAKESGLEFPELVANYEQVLIDNRILTGRVYRDGSGVKLSPHFRLTTLGYEICSFVDHYTKLV